MSGAEIFCAEIACVGMVGAGDCGVGPGVAGGVEVGLDRLVVERVGFRSIALEGDGVARNGVESGRLGCGGVAGGVDRRLVDRRELAVVGRGIRRGRQVVVGCEIGRRGVRLDGVVGGSAGDVAGRVVIRVGGGVGGVLSGGLERGPGLLTRGVGGRDVLGRRTVRGLVGVRVVLRDRRARYVGCAPSG